MTKAAAWILLLGLSVTGCDNQPDSRTTAATVDAEDLLATATPVETSMQKWAKSCALCHVDGTGGAPRVGVNMEWSTRLAQGKAVLLKHTIEGFNNMPPLGYCMSCEENDFSNLIDYMTGETP